MQLDIRELSTVLAALRLWQRECCIDGNGDLGEIATNGGEVEPLNDIEIDELCERINRL